MSTKSLRMGCEFLAYWARNLGKLEICSDCEQLGREDVERLRDFLNEVLAGWEDE